jgi:hypothetical protein
LWRWWRKGGSVKIFVVEKMGEKVKVFVGVLCSIFLLCKKLMEEVLVVKVKVKTGFRKKRRFLLKRWGRR